MSADSRILILDFGSQYTQLIARRLRELKVYSEIYPCDVSLQKIKKFNPKALILSGGPYSVYEKNAPRLADPKAVLNLNLPILGVCYGMQYLAQLFDGVVLKAKSREYGRTTVEVLKTTEKSLLFPPHLYQNNRFSTWMSHGDEIGDPPAQFKLTAVSENQSPAAMECPQKKIYAVQFHPEVMHTEHGTEILEQFVTKICQLKQDWDLGVYLNEKIADISKLVKPNEKAICALSGGVDSTVAATMIHQALGNRLTCVFVNNGLLRKNEASEVMQVYKKNLKLNIDFVDAEKKFLKALSGVSDSEKKRKIIGREFIRTFEKEALKIKTVKYLVQGTLYPDVIESCPPPRTVTGESGKIGFSSKIKSHHNVGGLPKNMKLKLIEPLRELFKDEVRQVGRELQIPESLLMRHPFPGPGLAVRILGDITKSRLDLLRDVDEIFIEEIRKAGLYSKIWQAFAVYLPIRSVGVMGDSRTYDSVVALRAVTSQDGMTADWFAFDSKFLARVSNRITGQVPGVNRVVYDISSKPPATIEWE